MKLILISLLLIISTLAVAQYSRESRVQTRISEDGSTLSIQIYGTRNGQKIHFDKTLDVANMNRLQIEILKYRVFTSVGAPLPSREMSRLIGLAFGLITLIIALLIVRFPIKKPPVFPIFPKLML